MSKELKSKYDFKDFFQLPIMPSFSIAEYFGLIAFTLYSSVVQGLKFAFIFESLKIFVSCNQ